VVVIARLEVPSHEIAENRVATTNLCKQEFNVEEPTLNIEVQERAKSQEWLGKTV
jgi:hypothetical protein